MLLNGVRTDPYVVACVREGRAHETLNPIGVRTDPYVVACVREGRAHETLNPIES
jgi:hypothetical protein